MLFSKRDLVKLLGPLIIEQILAVLVGMVDVVMVAAVGESAVAGVSLVDSISILIIQVFAALATGGAVVVSQYIGKKQSENACVAAGQLLMCTTMLSLLVTIIAFIGNRYLLGLIFGNIKPDVMKNAMTYFWLSALSYPFLAVYNSCAALYRSMGNSKVSMITSMIMNAINVIGNYICIFILHMGVEGVGIPTLVSRATAALLMIFLIQNPQNVVRIKKLNELRYNWVMIKKILTIGIPNGLENGMFQCGKLMLQSLVSSLTTTAIVSFAVSSNLVTLQYLPGNAIGLGLITIVGQCVGAGEYEQAKKYTKSLVLVNYGFLLIICSLMSIGSWQLIGLYHLNDQAASITREMILSHSLAMVIWPLAFTVPYSLRASLDAKFTMAVSVTSMWIFRIGFAWLFIRVWNTGILGIWYGMFIDWIVRAVFFVIRFHSKLGKRTMKEV